MASQARDALAGAVIALAVAGLVRVAMWAGGPWWWALASVMRGLLFGTTTLDPSTYFSVTVLLALGGIGASLVPARRAASGSPSHVLKQE